MDAFEMLRRSETEPLEKKLFGALEMALKRNKIGF
jgi:hypothetical protein